MDSVRSFVAIELPETVKKELARTQEAIRKQVAASAAGERALDSVKWVEPDSIHLTLKFLGSVPAASMPSVEAAVRRAAQVAKPFDLALNGVGVFPGWSRPRVLWVGVDGALSSLGQLQSAVEEEMASLGFPKETRAFSPHFTLARVRETASPEERRAIGEAVRRVPGPQSQRFEVAELSLMRSELSPRGARYTRIAAFPLG